MSTVDTPSSSDGVGERNEQLVVDIRCACGWSETVTKAENGQSLGGTAGEAGARHSCRFERGEVKVPKGQQTMRFNWVFR